MVIEELEGPGEEYKEAGNARGKRFRSIQSQGQSSTKKRKLTNHPNAETQVATITTSKYC